MLKYSHKAKRRLLMYQITNEPKRFKIDVLPWPNEYPVKYDTFVDFSYDEGGFKLHFVSYETNIRKVETEHNTEVCCDSCVEFFAQFNYPADKNYLNFEVNPNGAMLVGCQEGRGSGKHALAEDIDTLGITPEIFEDRWEVTYYVTKEFIKKYIPSYEHKKGNGIRANFYKCGDETENTHYVAFNNVLTPEPDFHRPEYFVEFELA